MNEQTAQLIRELAQKLGTTSEYLWGVLVNQARINAFTDILYGILIIVMGFLLYKTHKRFCEKDVYSDYEEIAAVPMIIITILWGIIACACFFSIGDLINSLFNPEYWALKEVLNACGQ